ncbi:MAG: DNA (cytosine-5-)-methyltransferase [Bacilli bacterium]|nr:DNA (cytosine-5-)-methyltransferase [Bacilli bacterium]
MKLKVLELFGGIGACSKALERIGIEEEIVDYVEIDKYAVKSFNAIFGTNFEPQDICEWDKDIKVDLIMHGSPCQDFSTAGQQAGGDKDSGTRSSLMWETIRIVKKLKPKYVIWENVKNLLSKKHRHNFDKYLETMEEIGYKNYYQVLNAKDYGIPQNRERVFTISIYQEPEINVIGNYMPSNHDASRIVDINGIAPTVKENHGTVTAIGEEKEFQFPKKKELKIRLKDLLEDEVDEKYYLSEQAIIGRLNTNYQKYKLEENMVNNKEIHPTILARFEGAPTLYMEQKLPGAYGRDFGSKGKVQDKDYCDTLTASMGEGGGNVPIVEEKKTFVSKHYDNFYQKNGYIPEMFNPYNESEIKDIAPAQTTQCGGTGSSASTLIKENDMSNFRIRKLTPKETWRLMGFDDEDFEKANKVNSNSQLYKQAGNSIVVNVLEEIFKELFKEENNESSDINREIN